MMFQKREFPLELDGFQEPHSVDFWSCLIKELTKKDFQNCSKSGKKDGINMFKAKGSNLRGSDANTFYCSIFKIEHSMLILITP